MLLYRLNPNSDELEKAAVECVLYVPGGSVTSTDDVRYGNTISATERAVVRSGIHLVSFVATVNNLVVDLLKYGCRSSYHSMDP